MICDIFWLKKSSANLISLQRYQCWHGRLDSGESTGNLSTNFSRKVY